MRINGVGGIDKVYRRVLSIALAAACLSMQFLPAAAEPTNGQRTNSTARVTLAPQATFAPQATLAVPAATAAQAPAATPVAYTELRNGSVDAEGAGDVLKLQQRLVEIGYLADEPDGYFGANTEAAVRAFQELNGLEATGVADADTQAKLFSEEKFAPAPTPAPTPRVNGVSGDDIKAAQEKLAQWGFLNGRADGVFGAATEDAVKAYKKYIYEREQLEANLLTEELIEDGEPVPTPTATPVPTATPAPAMTVSAAESAEPTAEPTPTVEPTATPVPVYEPSGELDDETLANLMADAFVVYREEMKNGSSGSEVKRLQTRLAQLGYLYVTTAGADGAFGSLTEGALRYFQRRNDLEVTGIADADTQKVLFSGDAKSSNERVFPYKLIVDVSDQRVYAYKWTGEGYTEKAKTMICSTGTKATPTPIGAWASDGRAGEWYYFKEYDCWAQYAFRIFGGYLFHSVTYPTKNSQPYGGAVANLGRRASHGCVRLAVEDAKWIYDNCPNGITVVVQE